MAITALQGAKIITTETKGALAEVRFSYPPELLQALRGMFGAGRVYSFQLTASSTQAASGGGVISGYFSWDSGNYSEWSALSALFDECRLRSSRLLWSTSYGPTSSAIIVQIALAPNFRLSGTSQTFTPVIRLAESTEFTIDKPGRYGESTLRKSVRMPRGRLWAFTTSTTSSTLDCGLNGQWSFASNIVTTPSINIAFLVQKNVVQFRCRA